MPWRTFIKLTKKAIKFTVSRPIQRFNIENRAKNYLGPDAKYFKPAPRLSAPSEQPVGPLLTVKDQKFITGATKLEVTKHVVKSEPNCNNEQKQQRLLPKLTNLPRQDLASIWVVDKVPQGRLDLNMLQEMMINKLADDEYWSPKIIADRYNIKEEYAASLTKYLRQIKIIVSPRMAKALDTVGLQDETYQAVKHIIYHVDSTLRSEIDRKYDDMFSPDEQLDPEVEKLLKPFTKQLLKRPNELKRGLIKRPEPLRISALNQHRADEGSSRALNEGPEYKQKEESVDTSKPKTRIT